MEKEVGDSTRQRGGWKGDTETLSVSAARQASKEEKRGRFNSGGKELYIGIEIESNQRNGSQEFRTREGTGIPQLIYKLYTYRWIYERQRGGKDPTSGELGGHQR